MDRGPSIGLARGSPTRAGTTGGITEVRVNEPNAEDSASEEVTLARVQPLRKEQQSSALTYASPRVLPLRVLSRDDLDKRPDPEWLVDDIVQTESSLILFGDPGIGKTFIALDIALCIATGTPWHGHPVRRGPVLYLTPEGLAGLKLRVAAWEAQHGVRANDFFVIPDGPQLVEKDDRSRLLQAITSLGGAPALIVIDTLARHFVGGDENNAKDMGKFVAAAEHVRKQFGCASMMVHHTAKGRDDLRGSGSLSGSAETVILAKGKGKGLIELSCVKQKESKEFDPMSFQLGYVKLPRARGEAGSCIIIKASTASPDLLTLKSQGVVWPPGKTTKNEEHQQSILRAFKSLPTTSLPLQKSQLEAAASVPDGSFNRAAEALIARGLLEKVQHGLYRLTDEGRNAANNLP